jgi:transcriptional regulator with XRE-family HTH domain
MARIACLHKSWMKEPAYRKAYAALEEEFVPASAAMQEALARKMGTTQLVVARLESGRGRPSLRTLDRHDLLAPHLDTLVRLLQAEAASPRWVSADDVAAPHASTWGPILVARHLFQKLSLDSILDAGATGLRHGPTANLFSLGESPGVRILSHSQVVEDQTVTEREFAHHFGDGLSGFLK